MLSIRRGRHFTACDYVHAKNLDKMRCGFQYMDNGGLLTECLVLEHALSVTTSAFI